MDAGGAGSYFRGMKELLALAAALTLVPGIAQQDVDITVVALNQDTLEVRLLPHISPNGCVMGDLTFTLRWDTTGDVHVGDPDQFSYAPPFCAFQNGAAANDGLGEVDVANYRYYTVVAFGSSSITGACGWTANVEVPFVRIPVNSISSCADFGIANDAFTIGTTREFHISLCGHDTTGVIYGTGALGMGGCSTGANEHAAAPYLSISPVPASEMIDVTLPEGGVKTWTVIDAGGRALLSGEAADADRLQVDVRALPVGSYALRLVTGAGVRIERFVVGR